MSKTTKATLFVFGLYLAIYVVTWLVDELAWYLYWR